MKKLYFAAVLALPLLATPASAAGFFPFRIEAGASVHFRVNGNGGPGGAAQLGPWYNYWPLEAHFITPAPTGYPYWPQPQALLPHPPAPQYPTKPDMKVNAGGDVRPVGYFYYQNAYYPQPIYYGPAPSYWYSRP